MIAATIVVTLLVVFVWLLLTAAPPSQPDEPEPVELHAIRRRLDVAWLKHQSQRDAEAIRRELEDELKELDS